MDFLTFVSLHMVIVVLIVRDSFGEREKNITRGPSYEHPIRTSDLMCYTCNNDVNAKAGTDQCVTMDNTSYVQVLRCRKEEAFCKVRRLETKGKLTTLDRQCSEYCTPGCSEGILNLECISCCKTPFCNTGNGAWRIVGKDGVASFITFTVSFSYLLTSVRLGCP